MRRFVLVAVLLAGCGSATVPRPAPQPRPAPRPQALREVDSFPLYELTDSRPTPSLYEATSATGWGCTVFTADGLVGRNFDFHNEPGLVLHHHPPGGYRSISLVDISYLGYDRAHLEGISAAGLAGASRLPFDGMNEKGLVVSMAAVPGARAPRLAHTTGELGVMRLALDHAANVAQAVAIFKTTAVDFSSGPPLHYLVADPSGAHAVIEYVGGHVHVVNADVMTNFTLSAKHGQPDHRFRSATATLARGPLTSAGAMDLLRRVRQPITRWSAVYDMRHRTVDVVMGQRYGRVLTFSV